MWGFFYGRLILFKFYLLLMVSLFLANPLQAEMVLNKGILNFYAGGAIREDIEITNSGTDPLYLSATVFKINQPEAKEPERIELTDPRNAGLLASPNKMIIPAGQKKVLRVIVRQAPMDIEQVYRIKVMPYAPPVKMGDKKTKQVGVKVLLGYELLAFVRPPNHHVKLNVNQQGQVLTVVNEGNTNTIIRRVKQCQTTDNCQELKGKRLYAGQGWEIKLPQPQGKIIIDKSVGGEFSSDEY